MKKLLNVTLTLLLLGLLAACENSIEEKTQSGAEGPQDEAVEYSEAVPVEGALAEPEAEGEAWSLELPAVERQLLFDAEKVKITVKEGQLQTDVLGDVVIPVLVENSGDTPIDLYIDNVAVNGLTLDLYDVLTLNCDAAAGESKDGEITISADALASSEIRTISELVVDVLVVRESGGDLVEEDKEIKTSLSGKFEQSVNTDGKVLYDQGGVKFVVREQISETEYGPAVVFYFENNSDKFLSINIDEPVLINGREMEHHFNMELKAGAKCIKEDVYQGQEAPIKSLTFQIYGEDAEFMGEVLIPPFKVNLDF